MLARPLQRIVALVQTAALLGLAGCAAPSQAARPSGATDTGPSEYKVSAGPAAESKPAPAAKPEAPKDPARAPAPARPEPSQAPMPIAPPTAQSAERVLESIERTKGQQQAQAPGPRGEATAPPAGPSAGESQQPPLRPRRGAAAQTGQASTPAAQAPGRLVVFNFDNADIEVVLQATSELLVFNYVLAPGARGKKVTVQTTGRIPVDDIFPVLLTILDVNGLAAVRSGNVYRIIPKEGAAQTSTRTVVGTELDRAVPGDEVLTMVVPLKFVSATDLATLLRPFVPQQGALTAHRDTNLLVMTDSAANVRRLLEIVKLIDVDVALSELQIFTLKFADAQDVAQILTQLFSSGRLRPTGAQLPAGVSVPAVPTAPGAPPRTAAPAGTDAGAADRAVLIVPERRSNSIIVYARKPDLETITRLVERLDTDVYGGQRIFIYFCENAKSRELTATLDAIFGRGTGAAPTTPTTTAPGSTRPGGAYPTLPSQASVQQPLLPRTGTTTGPGGVSLGEGLTVGAETRFVADEVTNSIIVTTYPRLWTEIEPIVRKLDKSPRQVLIEVLAIEVNLTDALSLGIAWAVQSGRFNVLFTPSGTIPSRPPSLVPPFTDLTGFAPGLTFFTFATEQFLAALNVLATDNRLNVLSNPSILTAENKKAVINVSRSVPILTSQQVPLGTGTTGTSPAITGTQTVEYKDAGIILTVTPRIGEQGTVALDVKQEFNDVIEKDRATTDLNSPEFLKREAETSVVLMNSQTLVLGGLIQNKRTISKTGIPFLNKIPIFGYLFGSTTERTDKTELLLMITPRVVGTAVEAARLTEEKRRITPEFRDIMRRYPRSPFWQDK